MSNFRKIIILLEYHRKKWEILHDDDRLKELHMTHDQIEWKTRDENNNVPTEKTYKLLHGSARTLESQNREVG